MALKHRDREGFPTRDLARIETGRARRFFCPARGASGQGPSTREAPRGSLGSDLQRNWGGTPSLFYRYSPSPQGGITTEMDL